MTYTKKEIDELRRKNAEGQKWYARASYFEAALAEIERLQQSQAEAERVAFNRGVEAAAVKCDLYYDSIDDSPNAEPPLAFIEGQQEAAYAIGQSIRTLIQPAPLQQAVTEQEVTNAD